MIYSDIFRPVHRRARQGYPARGRQATTTAVPAEEPRPAARRRWAPPGDPLFVQGGYDDAAALCRSRGPSRRGTATALAYEGSGHNRAILYAKGSIAAQQQGSCTIPYGSIRTDLEEIREFSCMGGLQTSRGMLMRTAS
jgi:hypothetical protein